MWYFFLGFLSGFVYSVVVLWPSDAILHQKLDFGAARYYMEYIIMFLLKCSSDNFGVLFEL